MASSSDVSRILRRAKDHEKEYKWLEAARSYEESLRLKSETVIFLAEIWQRIGLCYSLASRQTEDIEDFRRLRHLAAEAYELAARLFEKEGKGKSRGKNRARSAECDAIAKYTLSWLAPTNSERKKTLEESCTFAKRALQGHKEAGDELSYGITCNNLMLCLYERLYAASDAAEKQLIVKEGMDLGEQAISVLSKLNKNSELLLAYSAASLQSWYAANISEQEKNREALAHRSLIYSTKAAELSKVVDDPYYVAMSRWAATLCTIYFEGKMEVALEYAKEMLQQGSIAHDNYFKGVASYLLAFVTDWMVPKEVTANRKRKRCEEVIKYAAEAIRCLQLVAQDFIIAETYMYYAESYSLLARDVEVDVEKKRSLLEKAVKIGRKGLKHAVRSGSQDSMFSTQHALSKALHFSSRLETRKSQRVELLEDALTRRKGYLQIVEKAFPSNYWLLGIGKYYVALIEADLARSETDGDQRIALLKRAVSDMEAGISHCERWIASRPTPSLIIFVAEFEDTLGGVLDELYILTNEKALLNRGIEVFNDAATKYAKTDLPSRTAESYWKVARIKNHLGKHQKAAASFENASTSYRTAAQKIHQFADFYADYAIYMKAWSEIEKAKSAHKHEEYAGAMQHYGAATTLLKESKLWSYLASNFHAWSLLEHAEGLSREERNTESVEAFREAARWFEESKSDIEAAPLHRERREVKDEREMVADLMEGSETRQEYCHGRIALEEAKILDRQGDHVTSSERYGSAAMRFQKAADASKRESDRQELRPIICLCRAWQTMTRAEAENSPDLYLEASQLFEEAKKHNFNERAKILALGHSRFCKALEAVTRFEDTRDRSFHLVATRHLESAANNYIKAGFQTAAEYAMATRRLLDGYIYIDSASLEKDPEKKTRYYTVAEKVLQTSAGFYTKAKHPEKAKQVHQLLDKVKEERKLAASLSEILHAPTIAASTESFVTPTSSRESAVGLDRFEHANVQAHLAVPEEVAMDENLDIHLDLVNVAKTSGLLVRIDGLLPKGFRVIEAPSEYAVKDGSMDMGGKRFEPLKVESIKLSTRATRFGIFKVSPKVIYIDESGKFRTCSPEAVHVTVQPPSGVPAKGRAERRYELVYRDLFKDGAKMPRSECRGAIAQIGVSKSGDVIGEFYEEKAPSLFGLRKDKVETVRSKVQDMIELAHTKNVDILLFPELAVDLNYHQMLEDIVKLAKAYKMYIIPGSYHDKKTKRNVSVVVGPERASLETGEAHSSDHTPRRQTVQGGNRCGRPPPKNARLQHRIRQDRDCDMPRLP